MEGELLPATAAVVLAGAAGLPPPATPFPEEESDDDSGDDADDALLPPGPVEPDQCTVRASKGNLRVLLAVFFAFIQPVLRLDATICSARRSRGRATLEGRPSPPSRSSSRLKMRPASASGKGEPTSRCLPTPTLCFLATQAEPLQRASPLETGLRR